jgi:hypothetical protein
MELSFHDDVARYDAVTWFIIGLVLASTLLPALWLAAIEETGVATVLLAITFFDALLLWAVFPRKYTITSDKLRVILGGPFSLSFSLDTIEGARVCRGLCLGISLGSSITGNPVEVLRRGGMNLFITPTHPELFAERLNAAVSQWKRSRGISYEDNRVG